MKSTQTEVALRVLLVHDEPELRDSLAKVLRDAGHDVKTACAGASRIAERRGLEREVERARAALARKPLETQLVGHSEVVRRMLSKVEMVARSDAPTLITGESGTGKELVARILLEHSSRHDRPFVTVNCGALTDTLVEAELFGHERGAFTGAEKKRDGRFKAADTGTIFLDEVAELSLAMQAKLLRVLQEGTFEPIGSNTSVKVDVRVISATHRDLRERVRQNLFREDLFYRINAVDIFLPPLRDRQGDLALLVDHFLCQLTPQGRATPVISPAAWGALSRHEYPGNVRELQHAIQHAVILSGGSEITLEHLPTSIAPEAGNGEAWDGLVPGSGRRIRPLATAMHEFQRQYVLSALRETGGRRAHTAGLLDISRKTLWEKLKSWGIQHGACSVAEGFVTIPSSSESPEDFGEVTSIFSSRAQTSPPDDNAVEGASAGAM